jgi:prephenate dehydratase
MTYPTNIIAYQGLEGAYSHLACRHVYPDMQATACNTFYDAMWRVERGEASLAMIPLENSTAGRVEEIYRLMPKTQLHIIGEHFEPVMHCLLANKGAALEDLKTVSSHPQALAQCADHIKALNLDAVVDFDTAGSARNLSERGSLHEAAIASSLAAELYDLEILQDNFQDVSGNTTRFLILSKDASAPPYTAATPFITSLMFTVRNIPAALFKALGGFATNGINMVKLESYMGSGAPQGSRFHLDLEGHPSEKLMQNALEELAFFTDEMRILGTYQAHPHRQSGQVVE